MIATSASSVASCGIIPDIDDYINKDAPLKSLDYFEGTSVEVESSVIDKESGIWPDGWNKHDLLQVMFTAVVSYEAGYLLESFYEPGMEDAGKTALSEFTYTAQNSVGEDIANLTNKQLTEGTTIADAQGFVGEEDIAWVITDPNPDEGAKTQIKLEVEWTDDNGTHSSDGDDTNPDDGDDTVSDQN